MRGFWKFSFYITEYEQAHYRQFLNIYFFKFKKIQISKYSKSDRPLRSLISEWLLNGLVFKWWSENHTNKVCCMV